MQLKKVDALISLSKKALKLVSGETMVENALKSNEVFLVILAEDASENTVKKFNNMCNFRQVPLIVYQTKEHLGHLIGKDIRATIGIIDEGFAKSIISRLEAIN